MKQNELSTEEKLDLAMRSHKFYHEQCVDIERKINIKIDTLFQQEAENPSKEDIHTTEKLVSKLLTLSSKYMSEAENVIENLDELTGEEVNRDFIQSTRSQLLAINEKQSIIHERVSEMQETLIEMYNMDEDEDTF